MDPHNKGEGIKIEFVKRRLNKNDKINGITRVPRRQQPYPTQQMDKSLCLMCANRPLYVSCPMMTMMVLFNVIEYKFQNRRQEKNILLHIMMMTQYILTNSTNA